MQIGVVFPQTEIGAAVEGVRAYGLRVEELGFAHVLAYDHVLGADPEVHKPWNGPYNVHTTFHEPFVVFGYLAAITSLELVTGIIILPQRQTVLVAKQAAEVDLLSRGRFRLGVGLGWNAVEYEALGQSFSDRGKRMGEQVELLRRLWTEESVTYHGTYEPVTGAGLAPLPVQRPIPVWFGAASPPAYRRAGRLGDGWFPQVPPGPRLDEARAIVEQAAAEAGARGAGRAGGRVDRGHPEGGVRPALVRPPPLPPVPAPVLGRGGVLGGRGHPWGPHPPLRRLHQPALGHGRARQRRPGRHVVGPAHREREVPRRGGGDGGPRLAGAARRPRATRRHVCRRRARGPVPLRGRGRELQPRRPPLGSSPPSPLGAGLRRALPPQRGRPPPRPGPGPGRHLGCGRVRHRRRRRVLARRQPGHPPPQPARGVPRVRPVRAPHRARPGGRRHPVPPEPRGPVPQRRLR